jgi:hypothetical protein
MKIYQVVNTITTDTYSLEPGTGDWTEQMLLDHGLTMVEIGEYVASYDLFEITFLNVPPAPPVPPPPTP